MGNNNSKSDRLPDSYIENLDKRVSYSSSADISPELRQKFTNAHVVAYLAYSDNPHQALQQLGNIGHTIRLARKANPWIPEANQQYIVASNIDDTEVWIGLRGSTDVLKDWQRNFSLLPVPLAEGKIHCGFHACASEVYTKFISHLVSQGKRVIITGHGKGGATAQALTISLLLNAFEINTADINASVECIAIAAPLIIDSKLGDFVRSKKWDHIFHSIVNEGDIIPLAMTMFQENYLTKYFNILEYQKFFEYVVKLIEQGIKLGITIALSFANVPFAREIAEIIRKAITTAIKWISGKLALPSYYPFGFLYQLRSNCGQGIRAVTTAKEVIKLFTPPPLSDITEANVLLHSLNSYFVQFVSALPTGQTNTIPQQVALTADDFYNLDKTVASSSHRSVTEVNIKFSCRNPELIYHVIDPKSNLVSLPLLQQPEGNSMETMVSLSFVSRILNGLTPGDEFVVYAKPLFGDDVEIRCICPPLLDSPGNSYASLTLNQVVETSYYRILLMATVVNVNIEEQALISPEHSKQILQTLEAMDTLVNLVGLHQFLKFPKQTREKLENGAYDLPGKEGEASIQATANHVANLLEEAAMIPQFNESLSNDLLNSEIITLKRIVEISKRKRSNFNLPSELNSYLDAIAQKDIFGLIPNTSTYLPSNIHTALQTSSDTDSEELFTRARIALAVIDSLLIPNYEATIRRLNLVMQLSWVLKPAISLLPILDIQINEKKTWENIFNSDVKERNIVYLVVFSSIRIDSVFYSILPKIIMKSFFGLLAYFLPDDLIPVNFDEADLFGMETILSDRLTRVLGIRFLDQSFDEALDYYGTQDSAGRNLLQKLQELVEKDRYNIWNFMRALVYVHQLRTYLENSFFVGVIGTARLGKSRLIADLFHAETSHGPEDIHITRGVTSYAAKQKIGNDLKTIQGMYVIDFPGMDDVANLSKQMFRQGISAIDVFIVILEGKKPHLQSPMEILKQITELDMDLPILICLHRADEWAMNLDRGNKTLTAEAFKEQVKKVEKLLITNCKKYGIHPDALNRIAKVVPTCFDLQAKDYKDVLINSGVWDVVDVYRWLKMNPNIPPLWKDRLPDTWQFQTWKMDRTNTIN